MSSTDVVLDDPGLLADRLLRSMHRNRDGHLCAGRQNHAASVERSHNIAILYVYRIDSGAYLCHEHYVFSHDPRSYSQWAEIVRRECHALHVDASENLVGVYGWATSRLPVTPLRNNDLIIKIDKEGAFGARLSFGSGSARRKAQREARA